MAQLAEDIVGCGSELRSFDAALGELEKTVETHLRNIFAKAGVSSRVELARTVERADRGG